MSSQLDFYGPEEEGDIPVSNPVWTGIRNFEIQGGEDVDVLWRHDLTNII